MAWTSPRTWVTGEIVTSTLLNTHVRDNLSYLKTMTDMLDDVSQSDVTASRAIDGTVYQNTTGKLLFVTISVQTSSSSSAQPSEACIGSTSSPSTSVGKLGGAYYAAGSTTTGYSAISFFVPVGWYYKCQYGVALYKWNEWTLH